MLLNDVANDVESTQKSITKVIVAILKSETMDKLINRIPGSRLLISSLPSLGLRMHVKPRDVNKRSQSLCLVNLISKDTHLVSLYTRGVSCLFEQI